MGWLGWKKSLGVIVVVEDHEEPVEVRPILPEAPSQPLLPPPLPPLPPLLPHAADVAQHESSLRLDGDDDMHAEE